MADNVMGRPKIDIDQKIFENLCKIHCTLSEVAGVFNCSEDTIQRWCKDTYDDTFANTYKRFAGGGKASLKRLMWKHAEKSASMCIFLAKNLLGYKDSGFESDEVEDTCKQLADSLVRAVEMRTNNKSAKKDN